MFILAHRGYWKKNDERNTLDALKAALDNGFGIETDLRDFDGKLVISHNIADKNCPLAESFFTYYSQKNFSLPLALNIKADGLQKLLAELIAKYKLKNYFIFDMSIPELIASEKEKITFFTRESDVEPFCVRYENARGVWLDSFFQANWLNEEKIKQHLQSGKIVGIISSEIHGRDSIPLWTLLKNMGCQNNSNVYLCTDKPDEARRFFK
jgi:glycerophosphoryl diester phosphodiesterase